MKRIKGLEKKNKWMILAAVTAFCLLCGFAPTGKLAAAEEEDLQMISYDYLDPFDLTVTRMMASSGVSLPAESASAASRPVVSHAGAPQGRLIYEPATAASDPVVSAASEPIAASSPYAKPLKIWIPYRPLFRSPCTPSW